MRNLYLLASMGFASSAVNEPNVKWRIMGISAAFLCLAFRDLIPLNLTLRKLPDPAHDEAVIPRKS